MSCSATYTTYLTLLLSCVLGSALLHSAEAKSPYVISLFFRPLESVSPSPEAILKYVNEIDSLHMMLLRQYTLAERVSGIYACYQGEIAASDFNGQLVFPRVSTEETVMLLITTHIVPVFLHGRTIDHFIVSSTPHAAQYTCVRVPRRQAQGPAQRGTWRITRHEVHPFETISPDAIIIFADPRHTYILEGEYITDMSQSLVLPDIIIDAQASTPLDALRAIQMNRFFLKQQPWAVQAPEHYASILASH